MHNMNMAAGSTVRLTVTARPDAGLHRWGVHLRPVGGAAPTLPRLAYGSRVGNSDREQRIEIPAQDVDCWLEVWGSYAAAGGNWGDDRLTVIDDTPNRLEIGFSNPTRSAALLNDILLSFAFTNPQTDGNNHGQRPEAI
jgi:hypothetical protein